MLGGKNLNSMTPQAAAGAKGAKLSSLNSIEVQKQLQMQEDAYIDIIYHLEHDRMRLKGKDISLRLNKL